MRKIDYLTYGRDAEFSGNLFTQTLPVLISLIIGSVPLLSLPLSEFAQSLLFGVISLILLVFLYLTISWISERTYSVSLRNVRSRILSVCAYSILGGVVISGGYLAFVAPYPHPNFSVADLTLGIVYSLLYAELAAVGLVATVRSETRTKQVSEDIEEFLNLAKGIKEGTRNVEEDAPERLVRTARSIADSIREEPASGTKNVAERLTTWADEFEDEDDFVGREERISSDEFSELADDLCTLG